MKLTKISFSIFIISLFSCCIYPLDAEENFPKVGFVKNDKANVRAGDNMNFEILCKLEKGDPVKVIDRRYSWFKIILPQKAYLYIKNDYVDLVSEERKIGVVNAVRVNLRAGPDTKHSILTQVSKPETLKIALEKEGWYKIEPPKGSVGWVHSNQIGFSLEDINHKE